MSNICTIPACLCCFWMAFSFTGILQCIVDGFLTTYRLTVEPLVTMHLLHLEKSTVGVFFRTPPAKNRWQTSSCRIHVCLPRTPGCALPPLCLDAALMTAVDTVYELIAGPLVRSERAQRRADCHRLNRAARQWRPLLIIPYRSRSTCRAVK